MPRGWQAGRWVCRWVGGRLCYSGAKHSLRLATQCPSRRWCCCCSYDGHCSASFWRWCLVPGIRTALCARLCGPARCTGGSSSKGLRREGRRGPGGTGNAYSAQPALCVTGQLAGAGFEGGSRERRAPSTAATKAGRSRAGLRSEAIAKSAEEGASGGVTRLLDHVTTCMPLTFRTVVKIHPQY